MPPIHRDSQAPPLYFIMTETIEVAKFGHTYLYILCREVGVRKRCPGDSGPTYAHRGCLSCAHQPP
jgi:hypothetical protein